MIVWAVEFLGLCFGKGETDVCNVRIGLLFELVAVVMVCVYQSQYAADYPSDKAFSYPMSLRDMPRIPK
jgi:hypothetical protein